MTNGCANCKKHILYAIFVLIICVFGIFVLSACNKTEQDKTVSERKQSLYFSGIIYSENDSVMTVIVALKGKQENKLSADFVWVSGKYAKNIWFNCEDVDMIFDPSAVCENAISYVKPEDYIHDGVEYNHLKVALRYDTIYKSISSDANVVKQGKTYVHMFDVDKHADSQVAQLHMQTQNTANWYSMLIAVVLIFAAILIGVWLAIKGNLWQKKMKRNE